MGIVEDFSVFLQDNRARVYLIVLICAIVKCTNLYLHRLKAEKTSQKDNGEKDNKEARKLSPSLLLVNTVPPLLSISIISITWFYIFRFILHHQLTSESYFDDAYKDVLQLHYFSSTQLLTWAMVAVVWAAEEDQLGSIPFLLFGFLGAMGASFVMWIPSRLSSGQIERKRNQSFVPLIYGVTSIIAFICILKIRPCTDKMIGIANESSSSHVCSPDNGFGSFLMSFRYWLHGLHVVLLVPILVSVLPIRQMQIDSAIFYGIMGLVISTWHISQIVQNKSQLSSYPMLETDCQKSIHIDLMCCSILSLYAMYHDVLTDGRSYIRAMNRACSYALMMPLFSPAGVLSFHLFICRLSASYPELVGKMQRFLAVRRSESDEVGWCNLGFWQSSDKGKGNYEEACENLALELAKRADLKSDDTVLSCGCGVAGKELFLYKSRFDIRHVTGLDPCVHIDCSSFDYDDILKVKGNVEDWVGGRLLPHHLFTKILALDNIYHYPNKSGFFRHCFRTLPIGGKVAVTDIIWKGSGQKTPMWIKFCLSAMGVSTNTLWSEDEYRNQMEFLGFSSIKVERIGNNVFSGWSHVFPKSLIRHLEYAIIVATKETGAKSPPIQKKRIAVIGSGMAGLAAARAIVSSPNAAEVEVKIYESNSKPGLAGNTISVQGQLVDVPARMAALGYYNEYMKLVTELGIDYEVVKTDCNFHGNNGAGGYVKHIYELSAFTNLYNSLFVGGLRNLFKIMKKFSTIPFLKTEEVRDLTFGDWLHRHLNLYPLSSSKPDADRSKHQGFQLPHLAQHENPFLYMAIGSFSWMLSCTYHQLVTCPADILLPFIQGLGLTNSMGIFKEANAVRIQPSIRALEHALLHGIPFQGDTKVSSLNKEKIIEGIKYDAVICATEASAVPYVVHNCAKVFSQFHYHPSTIILHKDPSLMPKSKSDWRTWDVRMEPRQDEPQLTFWLNKYYDKIDFNGDVFQTWAPLKMPEDDLVIQKFELSRVVHTSLSKEKVKAVDAEQGKNGIYYAGSYAVYGMGLLEQAVESGRIAAQLALNDLFEEK